jgi:broad specificity phosphatase PhoE
MPAPSPTELWLIRHAEVERRYQGVFGGQIDMGLSPRGHAQAVALAKYLHQSVFAALYASPMRRVQETLAPVVVNGVPKPRLLRDLREVDFGVWTGLTFAQVETQFHVGVSSWLDQLEGGTIKNAESGLTLRARVEPCLRQIIATHEHQRVAVACHGGVIRMLLAILLELPLPQMAAFDVDYASVTQVVLDFPNPRLQLLNFAPWRELAL